ncbi:amino acid permease, partial [Vreelandella titanicae]
VLTAFFDLSRIAALGIIFYLIMDMAIHWGVLRHLKDSVGANPVVPSIAILLDAVVLIGFVWVKATSDPLVLIVASVVMASLLLGEWLFLSKRDTSDKNEPSHHSH